MLLSGDTEGIVGKWGHRGGIITEQEHEGDIITVLGPKGNYY